MKLLKYDRGCQLWRRTLSSNLRSPEDRSILVAATTTTATTGVDAHHYLAKDLQRAVAFYRDVIGLRPSPDASREHGTEFTLDDGSTFGVFKMHDGSWYPSGGVIFGVTDIDAAAARLRDAGIRFFTHGILDTPVCRIAWCEDPEGNNFAIHRRKPAK